MRRERRRSWVLHEMLTGKLPFTAAGGMSVQWHHVQTPQPHDLLLSTLSAYLEAVGGHATVIVRFHYRKLIVGLSDKDVVHIVTIKTGGGDPAELVRQEVEDFRLGAVP